MIRSTSEQFVVENPKPFNTWILNDFLVREFCFNDFSEIYLAIEHFSAKSLSKFFYYTLNSGLPLLAYFVKNIYHK